MSLGGSSIAILDVRERSNAYHASPALLPAVRNPGKPGTDRLGTDDGVCQSAQRLLSGPGLGVRAHFEGIISMDFSCGRDVLVEC